MNKINIQNVRQHKKTVKSTSHHRETQTHRITESRRELNHNKMWWASAADPIGRRNRKWTHIPPHTDRTNQNFSAWSGQQGLEKQWWAGPSLKTVLWALFYLKTKAFLWKKMNEISLKLRLTKTFIKDLSWKEMTWHDLPYRFHDTTPSCESIRALN